MRLKNTWIHDFGKFKMILDKNDRDISEQIKIFGWYQDEMQTIKVFEKYIKSGMIIFDLGANIGFYTMLARTMAGPNGKIFAFEPSPHNAKLIRQSIKENHFANITVVEAAVSDRVGKAALYLSPYYISEHSLFDYNYSSDPKASKKKIKVKTITIDHFLEKYVGSFKVDFIKMDIEGSESKALTGMKKVLKANKHLILVTEFWPNGFRHDKSTPEEFLKRLLKLRFKIYHIDEFEKKVYPVDADEMIEIADFRIKNKIEKEKITKYGDWYTNLLCIK